jgi:HSP20 family protein
MTQLVPHKSIFDEFFRDFPLGYSIRPLHGDPLPAPSQFNVEIKESDECVVVQAEIPGVDKNDIDISVEGNVLTIGAEVRQYDADTENEKIVHSERYYGTVQRRFSLPAAVNQDKAKAEYNDGILVLTLPKKAPNGTKKIAIN